jgi:FtsP/CotA-like multicopper oxidase with cupredoxin domain
MTDEPIPVSRANDLSRRGFLRGAVLATGGVAAATIAACTPTAVAGPAWTYGPKPTPATPAPVPSLAATAGPSHDHGGPAPSGSSTPSTDDHDAAALAVVQRFLGGEGATLEGQGNLPLKLTRTEGDTKVYELTVDTIKHQITATQDPVDALGFNTTWPGPRIEVIEGDRIRAIFKNNLPESTGIHFHGQRLPNAMDGVPHITQDPILPGDSFTYEFIAKTVGSHMYHSHHNATDQVGRGLLGAFIVHPKNPADRVARKYGVSQDIVWISNDSIGGFTINGRGFPATSPIVANLGEKILIRFMNEGVMTHPWHLHGMPMHVVARDGWELGSAAFTCDTLGVNPGERYDVVIDCDALGAWAFHCHILPHAEGHDGMFGMVTALVVQDPASAKAASSSTAGAASAGGALVASPIAAAARAAGSTALICRVL